MSKIIDAINSIDHTLLVFFLILIVLVLYVCLKTPSLDSILDKLTTAFLAIMTSKGIKQISNSTN